MARRRHHRQHARKGCGTVSFKTKRGRHVSFKLRCGRPSRRTTRHLAPYKPLFRKAAKACHGKAKCVGQKMRVAIRAAGL